jgi:CheY-like chemotaxis protein
MKKLLLVDDDAFLRDMYAIKFSESSYDVHIAQTANQALTQISQTPDFDVILLDMIMPGMTGVELIQEIHTTFPDMKACCIVLSNQGQESDIAAAKSAGAAGYIIKAEAIPSDVVLQVNELLANTKK